FILSQDQTLHKKQKATTTPPEKDGATRGDEILANKNTRNNTRWCIIPSKMFRIHQTKNNLVSTNLAHY
ncbi:hypothetical protein RF641_02475, partial [Arthrobacter sp. LS16]|uniref:hypothetical protein n=1 Tax=Arthrobacter sp. 'calajunan' TaxID=1690248 RepID=UPI003C77E9E7